MEFTYITWVFPSGRIISRTNDSPQDEIDAREHADLLPRVIFFFNNEDLSRKPDRRTT